MEQSAVHWVSPLGCCCSSHQGSGLKQQHCHEINRKQIHLQLPWLAQGHAGYSKPAAANAARQTGKPCWGLRALLGYWDGYPPLQTHSLLCLEEDSKYMHDCCLLSQQTAGLSELRSLDCSRPADFHVERVSLKSKCQGRDGVDRYILPQRPPQIPSGLL